MRQTARRAITAGTTFAVALSIGFVMQYGDALASRLGVDEPVEGPDQRADDAAVALTPAVAAQRPSVDRTVPVAMPQEIAVPQMQSIGPVSLTDTAAPTLALPATDMLTPIPAKADVLPEVLPIDTAPAATPSCAADMTAEVLPLAMVRLSLTDACHPLATVKIHHRGMMFSALTDAAGHLQVDVPALVTDALFIADFNDGPGAAIAVDVPGLDDLDRAVLQWRGEAGMQLHALEFGAGYDDAGHIWSASAGTPEAAAAGTGGFITTLGDVAISDALHAEIYTFPSGHAALDGQVILNVETEVTNRNCGRDVAAQSIQIGPRQPPHAVDLTMTMPDCDAIGEFLVLKNMFADLTLAAQ